MYALCAWHSEQTRFCGEVFHALCKQNHSFIHTGESRGEGLLLASS